MSVTDIFSYIKMKQIQVTSGYIVIGDIGSGLAIRLQAKNGYWNIESNENNIDLYLDVETNNMFCQDLSTESGMIGIFDSSSYNLVPYLSTVPNKEEIVSRLENEGDILAENQFLKYLGYNNTRIFAYMNEEDRVTHIKISNLETNDANI